MLYLQLRSGVKRLLAILAFAFAGIAAELANPVQCALIHATRLHRGRKPRRHV